MTIYFSKTTSIDNKVSMSAPNHIPPLSASAVLGNSCSLPEQTPICRGHNFQSQNSIDSIMASMISVGFQATHLGRAIDQIRAMRSWRLSQSDDSANDEIFQRDPSLRERIRARIFLAYTSNQISSGQREVIRFLVQNKMVDVIVTTAGGIEEDIIKCFEPTYVGEGSGWGSLSGRELRKRGINRIGNLLVPNKNYCTFEDWMRPLIDKMHDEQEQKWRETAKEMLQYQQTPGLDDRALPLTPFCLTPSEFIARLGEEINNEESVLYWAYKNQIPVFCPALTDGSIGDMMYFHSYKRPGFVLDISRDIRNINDLAIHSYATGQIILGGGIVKHHTCNANLMRNGADFSVYINTGHEFDGSDSGASPDEAISWGKIRMAADPVKVCADATIVFPLIVSQTFAKDVEEWKERSKDCVCWLDDLTV